LEQETCCSFQIDLDLSCLGPEFEIGQSSRNAGFHGLQRRRCFGLLEGDGEVDAVMLGHNLHMRGDVFHSWREAELLGLLAQELVDALGLADGGVYRRHIEIRRVREREG
jgi:hypothetical protein